MLSKSYSIVLTVFISLIKKIKEDVPDLNITLMKKYTSVEIELVIKTVIQKYLSYLK